MSAGRAARYRLKMQQLHGRAFPASSAEAEAQAFWFLEPDALPPLPPPSFSGAAAVLGEKRASELLQRRRDMLARSAGASASTAPEAAQGEKRDDKAASVEAEGSSAARREGFKDVWMKAMAEQFGEELNRMRQREPALSEAPERLALLIDSLRAGADVFKTKSASAAAGAAATVGAGAGSGGRKGKAKEKAGALDEIDEVDVVLQAQERLQGKKQAHGETAEADVEMASE